MPSREGRRYLLIDPTFTELSLPVPCLAFPPVKWAPRHQQLTWHLAWCWDTGGTQGFPNHSTYSHCISPEEIPSFPPSCKCEMWSREFKKLPEVTQLAWQGGRTLTRVFTSRPLTAGTAEGDQGLGMAGGGAGGGVGGTSETSSLFCKRKSNSGPEAGPLQPSTLLPEAGATILSHFHNCPAQGSPFHR